MSSRIPPLLVLALGACMCAPAWLLPPLPGGAGAGVRDVFMRVFVSVDLLAALTVLWLLVRTGRARAWWIAAVGLGGAWLYELYDVSIARLFARSANVYNDALLLDDALNLTTDLWREHGLVLVLGVALILAVVLGFVPWALRELRPALTRPGVGRALIAAWVVIGALGLEHALWERNGVAQLTALRAARNLRDAWRMHGAIRTLARLPGDPPAPPEAAWADPPHLVVFVVESYGRVLASDPALREGYVHALGALEAHAGARGFGAVSAWSAAPVRGGGSWLSTATLLCGLPIDNQPLYALLTGARLDCLPTQLERQGYRTAVVMPAMRARPGLPLSNDYRFDDTLYQLDLGYGGPPSGWGVVPDAFTLARLHERYLAAPRQPTFVYFAMVSSHAPWKAPAREGGEEPRELATLKRKARDRVFGATEGLTAEAYLGAIRYDLETIGAWLAERAPQDTLVVIVGDHQPPVLASDGPDAPVHLLARDPRLLAGFEEHGFTRGLLPADGRATVRHAGLSSLLRHAIGRARGAGAQATPYLPTGSSLAALAPGEP